VGLFALGSATQALAADLKARPYTKAPPPAIAPVYDWSGFYIGGNVGYGVGRDASSETAVSGAGFPYIGAGTTLYGGTRLFDVSTRGVIGGGQIGYNWQASPAVVFGIETDIQASDIKGSTGCIVTCGTGVVTTPIFTNFPVVFTDDSVRHRLDWFGTVRGRLGYSTGPSLFYVTGGFAYGDVERSGNVVGTTTSSLCVPICGVPTSTVALGPVGGTSLNSFAGSYAARTLKTGWTIGGGLESKIWNNWSVKAEYLYVDLGSNTDVYNTVFTKGGGGAYVGTVAAVRTETSTNRDHIFRVGLNYHFNPTLVARY
jgi:outer membrane immunogenic protein